MLFKASLQHHLCIRSFFLDRNRVSGMHTCRRQNRLARFALPSCSFFSGENPQAASTKLCPRCVAFDLDDTLWSMVETIAAAHYAMVAHMAAICPDMGEKYKRPAAFRELSERVKSAHPANASDISFVRKEAIRLVFQEFQVDSGDAAVDACFNAFFIQRNKPAFFIGAVDTLQELRNRGFTLGAITDGNADVNSIPELDGLFQFAVTAAQVGVSKPDPKIFARALELSGCSASEMLYVGDNFNKDVRGPAAVGIQAVWVNNPDIRQNSLFKEFHWGALPEEPEDPMEVAVAVIQSLPELLDKLGVPCP